ncbi:MAG: tryptophan--tRNA ligase [delta proteobacterium ML8_F1]|nr:MAG: tryptophan--tRNA ligase [delta proteobacterium ML8_F1]
MKRVFSGVQPSGMIHLGNYSAMKNFVKLQDNPENDCFYCIVDLHSVTVPQDPKSLYEHSLELAALFIAIGLDPMKSTLFLQSQVPAHTELAWLLQCNSYMGELNRMTQFKDKSEKLVSVTNGLYTYPILMAADILAYDTHYVPVGNDQQQHIELTRDIALRFNNKYGDTFVVPEGFYPKVGARIMSLDDPTSKMSKSNENALSKIGLLDSESQIKKSIMRATTDSESEIRLDWENKPGISNLLTLYSVFGNTTVEALEKKYTSQGYGTLKKDLVEVIIEYLKPIKQRYSELRNSQELKEILMAGAAHADEISSEVLKRVKKKMGFVQF